MTIQVDSDENPVLVECTQAVIDAIKPLTSSYDARLLLACLLAECAHFGALVRAGKMYEASTVGRMFCEAMTTALTLEVKDVKIIYSDGRDQLGSKQ